MAADVGPLPAWRLRDQRFENFRNLKHRLVFDGRRVRLEPREVGGVQQLAQAGVDGAERWQYHAHLLLANPLGVVTLLRKCPSVSLHHHRKMHSNRFANAAGAGLADEEIREM